MYPSFCCFTAGTSNGGCTSSPSLLQKQTLDNVICINLHLLLLLQGMGYYCCKSNFKHQTEIKLKSLDDEIVCWGKEYFHRNYSVTSTVKSNVSTHSSRLAWVSHLVCLWGVSKYIIYLQYLMHLCIYLHLFVNEGGVRNG